MSNVWREEKMICPNCDKEVSREEMKINKWKYCEVGMCKVIKQYYCPWCGWVLDREVKQLGDNK